VRLGEAGVSAESEVGRLHPINTPVYIPRSPNISIILAGDRDEGAGLEKAIRENLKGIGYEF
jgi:hypothetical protein